MARWYQYERQQGQRKNEIFHMNSPDKKCQWPNQKLIDEVVRTLSANAACVTQTTTFKSKRRSLLSKLKRLASPKHSIYIHLLLNKVVSQWPLAIKMWQLSHQSHSVPHTIVIASDRPCAFYIVHGDDIFTCLFSSLHEQCTFMSNVIYW